MRNNLYKFLHRREQLNKLYNSPKYRGLKYTAIGISCLIILLFIIMIIYMDELSYKMLLILRGSAGVLACIVFILSAIYFYRINRDYEHDKYKHRK